VFTGSRNTRISEIALGTFRKWASELYAKWPTWKNLRLLGERIWIGQRRLQFQSDTTSVGDSTQQNRDAAVYEMFIAGLPGAFSIPEVVNDDRPGLGQPWKEMNPFVPDQTLPIGITS
jgi:hypothetical protein